MAVKEKSENVSEEIEWNVETEVQLFYAMAGHKPVGPNKHFHMACILDKFKTSLNKNVTAQMIWKHLDTMYDMQALDDTESIPFPNEEKEFKLPFAQDKIKQIKVEVEEPASTTPAPPPPPTLPALEIEKKEKPKKVIKKEKEKEKDIKEEPIKESKEIKKEKEKDKEEIKEKKIPKEKKEPKEKEIKMKKDPKETPIKEVKKEKEKEKEKEPEKESSTTSKIPKLRLKEKNNRESPASRPTTPQSTRERRASVGSKRSLRGSIVKEESPGQSATPPPTKRRRI